MLNKLLPATLAIILAINLTACGKSNEQKKQEAQEAQAKKFWEDRRK